MVNITKSKKEKGCYLKLDNYHECLIQKKPSGGDTAKKALVYIAALILSAAAMLFIFLPFNLLIAAAVIYGAYFLLGNFSIEYEYIITNDEMDVDKIMGKRKRKRLITAPITKLELFGTIDDAPDLPAGYTTVLASDNTGENEYFCDFNHKSFGNVRIIFTPDKETVEMIEERLPNLLKRKMRQNLRNNNK